MFEDLSLRSPPHPNRAPLLMAPESVFQLATNRDRGGARRVEYSVVSSGGKGDAVTVTSAGKLKSTVNL